MHYRMPLLYLPSDDVDTGPLDPLGLLDDENVWAQYMGAAVVLGLLVALLFTGMIVGGILAQRHFAAKKLEARRRR